MEILLSTKGNDVRSWRGARDFAASYRGALLDQAASDHFGSADDVFSKSQAELEAIITTHRNLMEQLNGISAEAAAATPSTDLKKLTSSFYNNLYRHFGHFRSASAFYQLSMSFLCQISSTVVAHAIDHLGLFARHLPDISLIAVGPTGRGEYSPFCPLQLLLVHAEVAPSQLQTIALFCHTIHEGFENAGFLMDPAVTPRDEQWRGTLNEWRQRCEEGLQSEEDEDLINLYRLIDQYPLATSTDFDPGLKELRSTVLYGNHPALVYLIGRMTSLSNGIGLMGRLKLERRGKLRGMFRLLDHGLLPLSAALSACALIKNSPEAGSCERIHDLLKRRELDVELAERMLVTWHTLHDLWLQEQSLHYEEHPDKPLLLNAGELSDQQRNVLKEALESVSFIQRHVAIIFSGIGG
ncbi:MAG: putative nucleotidyltransferase substrate binding domain-containing protein [Desulfuromonadaceae bacterium]|nr:putative nucleotidyltransferase substrate binding domain-containing protein [Desulfuromonadaceae bacterium]